LDIPETVSFFPFQRIGKMGGSLFVVIVGLAYLIYKIIEKTSGPKS